MRTAFGVLLLFAANLGQAATLVGEAQLFNPGDLTVIRTDGGEYLQFLDLTVTQDMTKEEAVAGYAQYGFTIAEIPAVSQLFDAFDFTFAYARGTKTEITDATLAERTKFAGYLGETWFGNSTLGAFNVPDEIYNFSYFCIGATGCSPNAFTNDINLTLPVSNVGITMVRTAVPIPAAAWLFASGLALLGWQQRKQICLGKART